MEYLLTFFEGFITFISPCLLPMLPVYILYFAGAADGKRGKTLKNSLGFVLGFTVVFVILGAFAAVLGGFLIRYRKALEIISGVILVLFGLNYMSFIKISFLNKNRQIKLDNFSGGFFRSVLFGIIFSIGWTPCIGTFLGAALMLAAQSGHSLKGVLMLLFYSAGLGIPFVLSALLIDKLKGSFDFIKRNYRVINTISGILLIVIGIMTMTGTMGYLTTLFA